MEEATNVLVCDMLALFAFDQTYILLVLTTRYIFYRQNQVAQSLQRLVSR